MTIRCGCGREHVDAQELPAIGWGPDGEGGATLFVTCPCGSPIVAGCRSDASICAVCHALVTGDDGDVKIATDAHVLCASCHAATILRPIFHVVAVRRLPA